MTSEGLITWDDNDRVGKERAFAQFAESADSYSGISKGYSRDFIDIEPNRTVRPGFRRQDYDAFRPDEAVPHKQKRIMKMCMDAYEKVGIIRNVIDLMGDFGSQGINIVHENKSVEKFYQEWFKKVNGKERSERFLNLLYRTGNVICYRSYADINDKIVKYIKSMGGDIIVQLPEVKKNQIPWRYNFFNPLTIDIKDSEFNLFIGKRDFVISNFVDNFKTAHNIPDAMLQTLPKDIVDKIQKGEKRIVLDPERISAYYYKKDDWNNWSNPLIYAILDDIIMLEKMRLADISALDGAISNIRLWTLGNLEHKILPNKAGINKLRDILASNVGGGTMELVWGPELSYTESNSQVYKYLGSEKYTSVLNSIYAGLGVPPTLTGLAGNGGGFTNNFISLKTLIERLQYGRDQLTKFWETEVELVRKSMGFRKAPHVVFDQMNLSEDASEKNLLIQLADREIISHETLLERFKEVPSVEKVRLNREEKDRDKEKLPEKAGPFHAPNKKEFEKMDKQNETEFQRMEKQHTLDKEIKKMDIAAKPKTTGPPGAKKPAAKKPAVRKSPAKPNGRPKNSQDKTPRKQRMAKPRSKAGLAELIVWANSSFEDISKIYNEAYLSVKGKSNLRKLTKAEARELETFKLDVLLNLHPMEKVTAEIVKETAEYNDRMPADFAQILINNGISIEKMPMEEYKRHAISLYIEYILES